MFNCENVLRDLNIHYTTRGKNLSYGRLGICCPFCGDTGYHAAFTADGEIYTCWKCGWHKSVDALMALSDRSYYDVSLVIKRHEDSAIILRSRKKASAISVEMIGGPLKDRHEEYLVSRGHDPDELVEKYKITGTNPIMPEPYSDWANRIIIPIFFNGELVSYQGRDITGLAEIRYKFLSLERSVLDPKLTLYNYDNCKKDYVGLVEGAFKVFKFGSDCVSSFGVKMREAQYRLLTRYKKVYIMFDPDMAGRTNARIVGNKLAALGVDVEIIDVEDKPIDEMSKKEIRNLRKELDFD